MFKLLGWRWGYLGWFAQDWVIWDDLLKIGMFRMICWEVRIGKVAWTCAHYHGGRAPRPEPSAPISPQMALGGTTDPSPWQATTTTTTQHTMVPTTTAATEQRIHSKGWRGLAAARWHQLAGTVLTLTTPSSRRSSSTSADQTSTASAPISTITWTRWTWSTLQKYIIYQDDNDTKWSRSTIYQYILHYNI